ncbi:MAG: hypothetical protein E7066_01785 [Lentimicrobiaceae bacterium]|nr:hypothetical protein [Lentimicrobiaceae bacterium]
MKYSELNVLEINKISYIVKEKQPSLFKQICIFIGQLFYYTFLIHFKYKALPANYKGLLFFGVSLNNRRSLEPIINNVKNDTYLYLNNHVTDVHKRRAWWHSIPYLFSLIKLYKKSNKEDKALILKYFTRLWTTYGLYKIAGEMLDKYKVKVLVLANDHNDINRCLIFNALEKGIKTVYVQHASVKRGFPKLDFTYSFLDGKESLEKYLYDGKPKGEVYLSGGVRFDSLYDKIVKRNYETQRIGIAINMLDDFEKIKSLCLFLKNNNYNDLILRPHPRYQHLNSEWLINNNISISNPKEESSFDFISKIDFMISNESAIHLDASIMYCPTVLYNMSDNKVLDDYNFVKNNLVKLANTEDELLKFIKNPKDVMPTKEVLQYYNASSNSHLEGKLGITIARFLELVCQGKEKQFDKESGFVKNSVLFHEIDDSFAK